MAYLSEDPWDPQAIRDAARRRLAQDEGEDVARTPGGILRNAIAGAQRGSVGGPWGMLGGALSEGIGGAVVGQDKMDRFRTMTSGAGPMVKKGLSKFQDDDSALDERL